MHRPDALRVLFAALALAACSKPGVAPKTVDCVYASDCGPGESCRGGLCIPQQPATSCTVHADCPAGSFCDPTTMQCSTDRRSCADVMCPTGTWCEAGTGECRSGPRPCTSDTECLEIGLFCDTLFGLCRQCADSSHCPDGWACDAGTCVSERPECSHDGACRPPETVCLNTLCVPGCNDPATTIVCGTDEVCDTQTGRCVAEGGCRFDLECAPPDTVCESGACVAGCRATGCGTAEVCDEQTGRCRPESVGNTCVMDVDCAPPTTVCGDDGECTAGCTEPGGIACGNEEICNVVSGRCIPRPTCGTDTDCPPIAPVCEGGGCFAGCDQAGGPLCLPEEICNPGTGRCETPRCASNAHCSAPTPNCNQSTGVCYACTSRSDCASPTPECDLGSGACFACTADAQCAMPTPTCHVPTGVCTGCASNADCGGTAPICDVFAGACHGCTSNAECGNGLPPICNIATGQCTGCSSNAECSGTTPVCHIPSATCVGCVTNADCTGTNTPVCDTAAGTCRGCTSSSDCSNPTPICHVPSGLCLECVTNADCSSPSPICNATAICVGCQSTGCPNGQTCNSSTGECLAPLGSQGASCATDSDCQSNVCFDWGSGPKCTRSCGRPNDCDSGFSCHMVSGARMCIPPAAAPSSTEEIECTTDGDCNFGNRCVWLLEAAGRWDQRCRGSLGFGNAQDSCYDYTDCRNGICSDAVNTSGRFCRQPCDYDAHCQSGFKCAYIEHGGASYVQAVKGCVPINFTFNACSRDSQCGSGQVCKVINYGTMGGMTYLYNGCAARN